MPSRWLRLHRLLPEHPCRRRTGPDHAAGRRPRLCVGAGDVERRNERGRAVLPGHRPARQSRRGSAPGIGADDDDGTRDDGPGTGPLPRRSSRSSETASSSPFFAGDVGHLRPRQRDRARSGAGGDRRDCPTTALRTSRRWSTPPIAYAKMKNRLQTFACTSSIGPGATNMITGAATATVNRLPVLLLPGDTFASRLPHPVLQQLEYPTGHGRQRQRRLPPGLALLGPDHPAGAAAGQPARGDAGPDRPGRNRRGHDLRCRRTSRPRPTTIRPTSSRSGSTASTGPSRRRQRLERAVELIRGGANGR